MPDLVLTEPGCELRARASRLEVRREGELLLRKPGRIVDAVFVGPGVGVSAGANRYLSGVGCPLIWTTEAGKPLAWRADVDDSSSMLRFRQAAAVLDPVRRLAFAREIVRAKLAAMGSSRAPDASSCARVNSLRGIEGDATRAYFRRYWGEWPAAWRPPRRSKHPPRDAANALLSFGYGLLSSWMLRDVLVVGLDPAFGFVHGVRNNLPGLVQDLIEPFRSASVDPWALALARSGDVPLAAFESSDAGVFIADGAVRKAVVTSFLAALDVPMPSVRILSAPTAARAMRAVARETAAALNAARAPHFIVEPRSAYNESTPSAPRASVDGRSSSQTKPENAT